MLAWDLSFLGAKESSAISSPPTDAVQTGSALSPGLVNQAANWSKGSKGSHQQIYQGQEHLQEQRRFHLLLTLQIWLQNLDSLQSWQCSPGPNEVQPTGPSDPSFLGCVRPLCCRNREGVGA